VIPDIQYTGWCDNDFNVYVYLEAFDERGDGTVVRREFVAGVESMGLDVDVGLFQEVLQRHTVTGRSG
jgi:hypothetical protein